MPLLTEILGALVAGALIFVVARELGAEHRRALAAVSLVAISVAAVLVVPNLRDDVSALLHQRKEFVGLSKADAQVEQGNRYAVNTGFLTWVDENMGEGETFHLEVGEVPGEETFEGGGIIQGTIFAWATYQLGPHLSVEGPEADWVVFYGMDPKEYGEKLGEVLTYEPNFAMARVAGAG